MIRAHATSRRGFTFVLVIIVTIMATAMISWQLRRMHLRTVAVQLQIDSYAEHHQLLGVRDVVWNWARRRAPSNKMDELAAKPGPHYEAQLPGEFRVRVWVRDGQGTILANLKGADTEHRRDLMIELLRRVPLDRPDLTRRGGPMEMSILAMPDVVIDAICGGDQQLASAMRYVRDDTSKQGKRDMRSEFIAQGFDPNDISDIFALLTFTPVLWQLDVVADRIAPDGTPTRPQRYALLVELGSGEPKLHEWRPAQDAPAASGSRR